MFFYTLAYYKIKFKDISFKMDYKIAPSILSADFGFLSGDVLLVEESGLSMVHIDVMDGHFVPNITIGPVVVKSLRAHSSLFFDTHLMLEEPQRYIESFAEAGSDLITVHLESKHNLKETLSLIRGCGKKVGVSLNPDTSAELIKDVLGEIDMLLLMTVFPGFEAQSFIHDVMPKVSEVRSWINSEGLENKVDIQVDGGINDQTILEAKVAGANVFVVGNYVFGNRDIARSIDRLKELIPDVK